MRFKQWLLNEGFELPFSVIKDIYEYYRDSYEKYRLKPRVKIEPKVFNLDFTGTRYAFLNDLNPRVLVELKGSFAAGYAGRAYQFEQINGRWTAKIDLNLSSFVNSPHIVYHEVLHLVQDLIRIKKQMKVIGGLPNMPLVKRITDKRGVDIYGTKKVKRVQHGVRPIEYYTNLDSVIRLLQYRYVRMLLDSGKDMDLGVRDSEAKKEFFSRIKKETGWISDTLDTVKFDEELYRIYLQEISKRFILNNNFGPDVMPMVTNFEKFKLPLVKTVKPVKPVKPLVKTVQTSKGEKSIEIFNGDDSCEIEARDIMSYLPDGYESLLDELKSNIFDNFFTYNKKNKVYKISLTYNKIKKVFDHIIKIGHYDRMYNFVAYKLAEEFAFRLRYLDKDIDQDLILELFYPDYN
jgi:CRISPR/Cas system-associated exonuclease Cas4 (RecB family)